VLNSSREGHLELCSGALSTQRCSLKIGSQLGVITTEVYPANLCYQRLEGAHPARGEFWQAVLPPLNTDGRYPVRELWKPT
jgi:hypothetical protein